MSWFSNQAQATEWAGPNVAFPFSEHSFGEDVKLDRWDSLAMLSEQSELIAFGQCYKRLEKCHLARLAVSPKHRGNGLISDLLDRISDYGCAKYNTSSCSLFVYPENSAAIRAYQRYGFRTSPYEGDRPVADCLYMTKEHAPLG